ncbi:MAG: DUF2087 domain-containing protein [Nocardioides sp.]|uniref:DUF2087 domain-containing protein n=1 Tax=Nocardioides sp. TaxID=35761 RepID=UPI0039E68D59
MAEVSRADTLRRFFGADGRLLTMPTRHAKRAVVLDELAQHFEPGHVYLEREVVEILSRFHDDHAALRRYLVDDGFLTRRENRYWRSGGTVDVSD